MNLYSSLAVKQKLKNPKAFLSDFVMCVRFICILTINLSYGIISV